MDLETASPEKLIELGFTVGGSVMLQAVLISRPWSEKPPNAVGAYYLRTPSEEHTRLVWLSQGQVFEMGVSGPTPATDPRWEGAQWSGPIPMPADGRP